MPPAPLQSQNGVARSTSNRIDEHLNGRKTPELTERSQGSSPRNPSVRSGSSNFNYSDHGGVNNRMGSTDRSFTASSNQLNKSAHDGKNVRFEGGRKTGNSLANDDKSSYRDPQRSIGLRARTEQLEYKNEVDGHRQKDSGDGDQADISSSHPTGPASGRGYGQNFNRSGNGLGQRAGGFGGGMNRGGYGGMGGGYGGYGGGSMYGMGGMGMGMGMGMGSHMMMGPFSWIYSLNNIVHSIPMMLDVLGMNSQMLYHIFNETCALLMKIINLVKRSDFRRFLQQKSRRSKMLRLVFIIGAMGLASQALRLAKLIADYHFSQRRRMHNA